MKLEKSRFTENLVRINSLRFSRWVFEPGMLFCSESKWWGDKGPRSDRHNGLDLWSYETDDGAIKTVGCETKIPLIYPGRIVKTVKDFIGRSVFVSHEIREGDTRLFTIYGHLSPAGEMEDGGLLSEGTVIGSPASPPGGKVPGHIHLSVALIPPTFPMEILSWETLNEADNIRFVDPRDII